MSQSEFRVYKDNELNKKDWYYKLNVRPNKNMSASDFWHQFIYKLINDNEALIVMNDDNELLIADDFEKTEYAVYEDRFRSVTVKNYTFKKSFPMNGVIYLQYNNDKMDRFINGLFSDYGELFGRMVDFSLRNNQIRSTVDIEGVSNTTSGETRERLQKFVNKLYKQFSESSVAIVPQTKGLQYNEVASGSGSQSYGEISSLKNEFVTDVAKAVGVPPALVHGEM
ncbi:phage portal protein, partial [Salmonella enterica]|uniref:phage portal protein n=1 Tax=Salmonella enterica TaxID=28901 RepID=UPI002351F40B